LTTPTPPKALEVQKQVPVRTGLPLRRKKGRVDSGMRDWPAVPDPKYRSAVFLDRDGTINVDSDYPHDVRNLELIPHALGGLQTLARLPVHVIVFSNQAGIALGLFTRDEMSRFNSELRRRVEKAGGRIDAFYYCPHREAKDLTPGEIPCPCSKPGAGMLFEAAQDFGLDLRSSVVIGDKRSDVMAGKTAGCLTILLETGKTGKEEMAPRVAPDFVAADLSQAAVRLREVLDERVASRFS
jgi:D-glycero-D-manno-heptose 1,7-bisphosphate phosphatase